MANGLFGTPTGSPLRNPQVSRPSEDEQARSPSVWDRIMQTFGGAPNPMLSAQQNREAQRMALVMAGLQMMAASGPQAVRPNLGAVLAAGAMAGQQAGGAARQNLVQQGNQAQMQSLLEGGVSPEVLQQMFAQALATGDIESARALSEVLKSMNQQQSFQRFSGVDPETGENVVMRFGPTGQAEIVRDAQGRPIRAVDTTNPMLDDQRMFMRERQLAGDYLKEIQDLRDAYRFIDGALQEVPQAARGEGPAQVNLLYAFVRAMDPNSVVREGEVRLVEEAASVRQRAMGFIDKYTRGEAVVVPGDMVDQMAGLMTRMQVTKETYWQESYDRWSTFGARYDVNPLVFGEVPTTYRDQASGRRTPRRSLDDILGGGK